MFPHPNDPAWYAVAVRPRAEKAVAAALRAKGFTEFLPLYTSFHRSGRRITPVQLPLFPGYTFAVFEAVRRAPILTTPGVFHIVGNGPVPAAISDAEIAAIQRVGRSGLDVRPSPFLDIGEMVQVEHGPLRGLEGLLVGFRGKHRLILSVALLRRSISVEIDRQCVGPARLGAGLVSAAR